jgi:hypothetical protein
MTSKISICLTTPMYGGSCFGEYTNSVLGLQELCMKKNWGFGTNYIYNESLITRGRNELVYQFLETDKTHLMFVDSDIVFDPYDVIKLVEYNKDIVCGIYPKKSIDWNKVVYAVQNGIVHQDDLQVASCHYAFNPGNVNAAELSKKLEGTDLIDVRHAATGFMLVKREVFIKLFDKVDTYKIRYSTERERTIRCFFDTKISENSEYLSEDWFFCDLWRKHGGQIYIDPQIRLKHAGMHIFG